MRKKVDDRLRSAMRTQEFWSHLIRSEADSILPAPETKTQEYRKEIISLIAENNVKRILQFAESPIEQILLANVAFLMWYRNPVSLIYDDSIPFVEADLVKYKEAVRKGKRRGLSFSSILYQDHEKHEADRISLHALLYDQFDFKNAVHMLPQWSPSGEISEVAALRLDQATLDDLQSLRVDIVFVDFFATRRVAVECDGYQWHKKKFETDRQRDRLLNRSGFDVLRYAGTEIYHNPVGTAAELTDDLFRLFPHAMAIG